MNKAAQQKAIYRTPGTIDVVGAARSCLIIGRDPDVEDRRILVQQKSNLAPTGNAIVFSISEDGIEFLEERYMTADELLTEGAEKIGRPAVKTEAAVQMMKEMLKGGKELPAAECREKLQEAGYHAGTITRAKAIAGVDSRKVGASWFWSIPDRNQDVNKKSVGSTMDDIDDF